jgi:hypothetical protein
MLNDYFLRRHCPKCDNPLASTQYDKTINVLIRQCQCCGYIWQELPLDYAAEARAGALEAENGRLRAVDFAARDLIAADSDAKYENARVKLEVALTPPEAQGREEEKHDA